MKVLIASMLLVAVAVADPRKPSLPVFMRGTDDSAKQQFLQIVNDNTLSGDQKDAQIEALMQTQPQQVQANFQQFRDQVAENKKKFNESVGQQIGGVSPQAQRAIQRLNVIQNSDQPQPVRDQRAQDYFETLPDSVQQELTGLKSKMPAPRINPPMTTDH